ncbi:branched-chain amino acid aminotransferase [Corynebacterium sp. sy017]|uniref:branched-chain amino acid aminotransferase n=1 Tax=unclassified Corynebacterium TaxID=2624378 RepID=UPI00118476C8|nr:MULTISPECIES: branched-chain amino acid aminotransferase [unclassified Corynebacterium]MBP3087999.1 branched-chain amino acid aminotransferase [Corynebacterium sp. sy017]QDZ42954.1 branched-chain amino acid aminotransferase [Corynebacterium sp. sy039]TSD92529.1 branched-chain amino acid aminotransferase [Corynebacterium sp. SY003]
MTSSTFTVQKTTTPTSPERLQEILANPGFGKHFSDHMVTINWNKEQGWHDAKVVPYQPISLDPATSVLHYGQAIFEGLKAYRHADGSIKTFRPLENAHRFQASAQRLAMPELPEELFIESIRQLVDIDRDWVPAPGGEEVLYLRPFMIATENTLGVSPSQSYMYILIASPAGAYFADGIKPVSVWLSTDYVRAAPGGTGAAKCAGNYAASLLAQAQATEEGCEQVVWLDAKERTYIEEMGGMNMFFVQGKGKDAQVITPRLSGSILPGVTRQSIVQLAQDLGYHAQERLISVQEWEEKSRSGEMSETFACGTAAVITPVGSAKYPQGQFSINGNQPGEITMQLREKLTGIQKGTEEDIHGWMYTLIEP